MAYRYELVRISNTHNAIADWLVANPGKGQLGRCAVCFDVTRSWLSTLIHTDAFKALLRNKQEGVYEDVVIPLVDKIMGVAHRSAEVLGELLDDSQDEKLKHSIAKDTLAMCGYGTGAGTGTVVNNLTQNNQFNVNGDALEKAKRLRDERFPSPPGGNLIESQSAPASESNEKINAPQELTLSEEFAMGETRDTRAELVNSPEGIDRASSEGDKV